jgi:hypothetical protein
VVTAPMDVRTDCEPNPSVNRRVAAAKLPDFGVPVAASMGEGIVLVITMRSIYRTGGGGVAAARDAKTLKQTRVNTREMPLRA